jgi:hypothetical protein
LEELGVGSGGEDEDGLEGRDGHEGGKNGWGGHFGGLWVFGFEWLCAGFVRSRETRGISEASREGMEGAFDDVRASLMLERGCVMCGEVESQT